MTKTEKEKVLDVIERLCQSVLNSDYPLAEANGSIKELCSLFSPDDLKENITDEGYIKVLNFVGVFK